MSRRWSCNRFAAGDGDLRPGSRRGEGDARPPGPAAGRSRLVSLGSPVAAPCLHLGGFDGACSKGVRGAGDLVISVSVLACCLVSG